MVDALRDAGAAVGSLSICSFRPFPLAALAEALDGAKRVVVVEKSLAPGLGGMVASNVRMALSKRAVPVNTVIAGLGGPPITTASLRRVFEAAGAGTLEDVTFLDLNRAAVDGEIKRARATRKSGPAAENILRQLAATRPAAGV